MSAAEIRLPERRLSTAAVRALYPAVVGPGLGAVGVYVGLDERGARFFYDPWSLYERGVCPNPSRERPPSN